MRKLLAVLSLATMVVACSEDVTAPRQEQSALEPQFGLTARTDSSVKIASISWTVGPKQYYATITEGSLDNAFAATLGYMSIEEYPCQDEWGQWTTCYDMMYGFGMVPRADVRGGQGTMTVSTNTSPAANPDFQHFNDAGGLVAITVRQVPGTQSRYHVVGHFPCDAGLCTYNVTDEGREATVSGVVAGIEIPPTALAWIGRSSVHSFTR